MALSMEIIKCFLFIHLSSPGNQWSDDLHFVPAANVSKSFRSSKMQGICDGNTLHHSLFCSVISPESRMSRAVHLQKSLNRSLPSQQLFLSTAQKLSLQVVVVVVMSYVGFS